MIEFLARGDAVDRIADHITGRAHWVAAGGPDTADDMLAGLHRQSMTVYVDNGTDLVLATPDVPAVRVALAFGPVAVIAAIPKATTPARRMAKLFGEQFPADGSQDLILGHRAGPRIWPTLLVDSIALVDPLMAATLYANDLRGLS
jgi:hypothetical protein